MPSIIFKLPDGSEREILVDPEANVMRTALAAGIPGIVAECGGAAMCATCHVYVAPESMDGLPPLGDVENEMLDCAAGERRAESRLSCQLFMPASRESITVRLPASQY